MAGERLRGRRVLVVEDDALIAMLIEEVLREHGATVSGPLGEPEAALRAAESEPCDLALLDVNVTVLDLHLQHLAADVQLVGFVDTLCGCRPEEGLEGQGVGAETQEGGFMPGGRHELAAPPAQLKQGRLE